jgi:hypothetical protein
VGRGRRKLGNEEFDDLCVGKGDEVMESEMDGNVIYMGVKSKMGIKGGAPHILNLFTEWRCVVNCTPRPLYTRNDHRYQLNWRLVWFQMLSER